MADLLDRMAGGQKPTGDLLDRVATSTPPGSALERTWNAFKVPAPAGDWPEFGPQFRKQVMGVLHGIAGTLPAMQAAGHGTVDAISRGDMGEAAFQAAGMVPGGSGAQRVGQDVREGKLPEALGHFGQLVTGIFGPRIIEGAPSPAAIARGAHQGSAVAAGAAKGAWEESMTPSSIKVAKVPVEIPVPKIASTASMGATAGGASFGQPGAVIGGVIGTAYPIVKGAIKGGAKANRAFKAKGIPPPPTQWPGGPPTGSYNPVVGEGPLVSIQDPPVPVPYNPVVGEGPLVQVPNTPIPIPYNPVVGEGPLVSIQHPPVQPPYNPVVGEGPLVSIPHPLTPPPYNPVVGEGPTVQVHAKPEVPYNPVVGEGPIVQVPAAPPRGQTTTGTGTGFPPMPGAKGGPPLIPLKAEQQAVVDRVMQNSTVIPHPEGMPQDYVDMIKKYGADQADKAWKKDVAIAKQLGETTLEAFDQMSLADKNIFAKAAGRKAFDKGGVNSRGAELGIQHVRNRLEEMRKPK